MVEKGKIKILHIGWGFRPYRGGGLIEYAEDLMEIQAQKGYNVYYFFSGRHFGLFNKPILFRWKKNNVKMLEVINSPIVSAGEKGNLKPEQDIQESAIEDIFEKVLDEIKPHIIHIHELYLLPSSLIEVAKKKKFPIVMTLHDYFLLCPTVKLFDIDGNTCLDKNIGVKCIACNINAPRNNVFVKMTYVYVIKRFKLLKLFKGVYKLLRMLYNTLTPVIDKNEKTKNANKYTLSSPNKELAEKFQKRRDINIDRLNKIDLLICQSKKVEQIYSLLTEGKANVVTLHSTVKHIQYINPKFIDPKIPLNFATINGCASRAKGAFLILDTLKILKDNGLNKYFVLHIFGGLTKEIKDEILSFENVIYHGPFDVSNLNNILEKNIHVGIIPSIWEEVYGYVGIEFLAKGIPVIGNNKGGIVDYVIEGYTGFINYDNTATGLANIVVNIISNPSIIKELNMNIVKDRNKIIKTMEQHFYEIDRIYREVIKNGF